MPLDQQRVGRDHPVHEGRAREGVATEPRLVEAPVVDHHEDEVGPCCCCRRRRRRWSGCFRPTAQRRLLARRAAVRLLLRPPRSVELARARALVTEVGRKGARQEDGGDHGGGGMRQPRHHLSVDPAS